MKTLSTYTLAIAMAALTVGCKKDSEPTPPTKTELLTAKKWRVTAASTVTTVGTNSVTVDEYAGFPACERDDFRQFLASKVLNFDEGATKCDVNDPQTTSGVWDFNSDQTKLTFGAPGSSFVGQADLAELSATTLKIRQTDTSTPGTTEVSTLTFTAF